MSPDLRSSSSRGSRKIQHFPHSLRQQKGMLEKEQREENTKTKKPAGSAELMGCAAKRLRQARHALSSATPANSSCHSPARGQGPEDAGSPEGPARACPSVARPVWPAAGRGMRPLERRAAPRPG